MIVILTKRASAFLLLLNRKWMKMWPDNEMQILIMLRLLKNENANNIMDYACYYNNFT